jgi:site-specific recombinase XerD
MALEHDPLEHGICSIEVFSFMLDKFSKHITSLQITTIKDISYQHLLSFVISGNPSAYTKKHRVWTLHQFFHYLKTIKLFKTNIALKLPYPKIDKKEPDFLSVKELKIILNYFISATNSHNGVRNLIIVLFLVFLGLRISATIKINIQDINLKSSSILVTEKGNRKRTLLLPQVLCFFLYPYIKELNRDMGPLFSSTRNKTLSHRMVQHFFKEASNTLGMHIYSRIFRHTAATHLNQVAGLEVTALAALTTQNKKSRKCFITCNYITSLKVSANASFTGCKSWNFTRIYAFSKTKHVLGHRRSDSTKRYVHLNPDVYAEYMKRHPFMKFNVKENNHE